MSVTVVGSVALDTVDTPSGENIEGLGGAATFFSLAASNFTDVNLVGVIGTDFPEEHIELLRSKGINLEGLEQVEGKTFRWKGHYHDNLNVRDTLETHLNVFETFEPKLPDIAKNAPYLFLGNIHPSIQMQTLEQTNHEFVALDTMNLWIDIANDELKAILGKIDCLIINDEEVVQLTGDHNIVRASRKIQEMGPRIVASKKGEHGCLLFHDDDIFSAPAYPMEEVVDPTGAGDSFAGGFMGYIAQQNDTSFETLKKAVIQGSVVASYLCSQFGPDGLINIGPKEIEARYQQFVELSRF
ncbi:MAG: PfkB family carbohydrate kinase [Candidatus Hydrogenedentota bacterium]